MQIRKIIHVDMDAFYASVEQRDFPEYRGQPVIVGGAPEKRGVVAACSYEARSFGIHSAMPSSRAYRLCPQAIFLRPRFDVYRRVSVSIHAIFKTFSNKIEPLSLDEAYLDVTEYQGYQGSATHIALAIKQRIHETTGLTASAGVSYNKFLAKTASDMDKPDGLYVITPEMGPAFVEKMQIGRFYGIGKATEAKMNALGICFGADLKKWTRAGLKQHFGKAGDYYYDIARGIDNRPLNSSRVRKSLGSEETFDKDLGDYSIMLQKLETLAVKVISDLRTKGVYARTITVKVKYSNFELVTRSRTLSQAFNDESAVLPVLPQLLSKTDARTRKIRLLGLTLSNLMRSSSLYRQENMKF